MSKTCDRHEVRQLHCWRRFAAGSSCVVSRPSTYGKLMEPLAMLDGSGGVEARNLLRWTRWIKQRWTCSRAYRSGVEPPLPRLYTAGPVRDPHVPGSLRAGFFCSRLIGIRARCVLLWSRRSYVSSLDRLVLLLRVQLSHVPTRPSTACAQQRDRSAWLGTKTSSMPTSCCRALQRCACPSSRCRGDP